MDHRFFAYDVAVEIARALVKPLAEIKKRDTDLSDQAYRALKSMGLAVAEGGRRVKKDRRYHFDIAGGSAQELRMALELAVTFGFVDRAVIEPIDRLLDRELAMIWRLGRNAVKAPGAG